MQILKNAIVVVGLEARFAKKKSYILKMAYIEHTKFIWLMKVHVRVILEQ
jgi:hypothetical protein